LVTGYRAQLKEKKKKKKKNISFGETLKGQVCLEGIFKGKIAGEREGFIKKGIGH